MKTKHTTAQWEVFFKSKGIEQSLIPAYINYIDKLNSNNVPIIFEFNHLSEIFGINKKTLAKIVNSPKHFYRTFSIPKRRGGLREIQSPYPSLLHCQQWVYKNILLTQKVHPCAHGFVPTKSIFSNATIHMSQNALLKIDIQDFFPSIPINWVINFFSNLGYAKNVSFYLSSVCCYEDRLSQGAATSPYLSNLLLYSLDNRIKSLADKYNLNYSRYADDITISGKHIPYKLINTLNSCILNYGFKVNTNKTQLIIKKSKKIVTGLSVSTDKLKIPRSTKRELRQEIYNVMKYGYLAYLSSKKIKKPYYIESLIGKINFWLQAEPENKFALTARDHFNNIRKVSS